MLISNKVSIRESIKKLNSKKKILGHDALWDNGKIFTKNGKKEYCILSISGTQGESEIINIAVLDKSTSRVIFYILKNSLTPTKVLDYKPKNPKVDVLGVKFSPITEQIYYVATQESIIMYDQRMALQVVETFKVDIDNETTKNISCFDVNCNEKLIAAGTENINGDVFILFWDIRYQKEKIHYPLSSKLNFLGGYWESHTDDITWLAFHPTKENILASGSTDGLMNVFDLKKSSEDEALKYSLNTESSVDRLGWLANNSLWCTTHMETLQLWHCKGANPYAKFERSDLAMSQDENPDDCYVVKVHTSNTSNQPFLLAGCSTAERQRLRCLSLKNNHLDIYYNLIDNEQIVRDSWLHEKSETLVTAGEGDFLNVWKLNSTQDKFKTKMSVRRDSCRTEPY